MLDHYANGNSIASSTLEKLKPVKCQTLKSQENSESFLIQDQKMDLSLDRHGTGAERKANQSLTLLRPMDHDPGTWSSLNVQKSSYFAEGNKVKMTDAQHENSLFSSSLSELFSRKLRLPKSNAQYGHSVDTVASHFEEEEPFESLKEIEAQTIGNLLPDDDDLLSGVTDGIDFIVRPNGGEDVDELDFFSSIGGMDLGDDGSSAELTNSEFHGGVNGGQRGLCNGLVAAEHPYGEHPSRTLFVRNINSNVEDSELKELFEQYGDIRTLYTACKHRGFVMISYYDIRAARNAMKALQNRPLRRRKLDIHYSIPKDNPSEKDINQGTLVVFNLDASVSNDELHQIFGVYGEIKEIRETPHRSHHKFIEYYDVRAAETALRTLNRSDIAGKRIKLEPSRPGSSRRCSVQHFPAHLDHEEFASFMQQNSPSNNATTRLPSSQGVIPSTSMESGPILGTHSAMRPPFLETTIHHGISSSVPNSLTSLVGVEPIGHQSGLAESACSHAQLKFEIRGSPNAPNFHPHSLPEYHDGLTAGTYCSSPGTLAANVNAQLSERTENGQLSRVSSNAHSLELSDGVYGSAGHGSRPIPGHHYTWSNAYHPQPASMMWPSSPSFNGIYGAPPPPQLQGLARAPSHMMSPVVPINNHHVGSAPAVNPSLWDGRHAYAAESPDASGFHPGSLGSVGIPNSSLHPMDYISHNIFPHVGGNCMDMPIPGKTIGIQSHLPSATMFPGRGQMIPTINSFDLPNERSRSRRTEGGVNQADKKQYELDIDRILRGQDNRTTLMIKNIPNKYTSKMLLAAIDERHRGTYDFVYLPIDFKNKCNVGYAFINMTDPSQIIPFYQAFNGKKWEKFNSEKVASLAYARIQGKAALIAHFQNSSLMNEDKRCRPILFNTDGPNAGDQVPFPMGVNVRSRPGKARTTTHDENNPGISPNLANGEDSFNGDASSCSTKDSD